MTLGPARRRAYSCGALTGAFSTVALLALVCGALAVGFEEAAQG
jgi:hypothetical protein